MSDLINQLNDTTIVLLTIAIILLMGFLLTRVTKPLKLPNVTGYIIAGIIIGPHVLKIIPIEMINSMAFMSDIALAFIAFGVGRFFKREAFKETGWGIFLITILESILAGIFITLSMHYIFNLEWHFSLLLGAIATATAPASTMATIRQYNARGKFVNTLLQVVALDDAVCLIIFSVVAALITTDSGSNLTFWQALIPIALNIAAIILGFFSGFILSKLMTPKRSEDNRLILSVALLLGLAGLCAAFDISPLLSCMIFGTTYVNLTKDKELFKQLDKFTPPILSIFFVVSGMNLDITSFATLGVIGAAYFLIRIIGKYLGAYLGSAIAKMPKSIKYYLGFALVPQAGVAIGLAFLGKRIIGGAMGDMLLTIILSSSVLYELIGPASAKFALFYSGSIKKEAPVLSPPSFPPNTTDEEWISF